MCILHLNANMPLRLKQKKNKNRIKEQKLILNYE